METSLNVVYRDCTLSTVPVGGCSKVSMNQGALNSFLSLVCFCKQTYLTLLSCIWWTPPTEDMQMNKQTETELFFTAAYQFVLFTVQQFLMKYPER